MTKPPALLREIESPCAQTPGKTLEVRRAKTRSVVVPKKPIGREGNGVVHTTHRGPRQEHRLQHRRPPARPTRGLVPESLHDAPDRWALPERNIRKYRCPRKSRQGARTDTRARRRSRTIPGPRVIPCWRWVRSEASSWCHRDRVLAQRLDVLGRDTGKVNFSSVTSRRSLSGSGNIGCPSARTTVAPVPSAMTSQFHIIHPAVV